MTVVTDNWLGDLRFIVENGIEFRADLAASGGSDTAFFREAVAKGVRHGWCADAIVYDRLPARRISLAYQFRRAQGESTNHFHVRHPEVDARQRLRNDRCRRPAHRDGHDRARDSDERCGVARRGGPIDRVGGRTLRRPGRQALGIL